MEDAQCGGFANYNGLTCCPEGTECQEDTDSGLSFCTSAASCPDVSDTTEYPSVSAKIVCEDAGCVYTIDQRDFENVIRYCRESTGATCENMEDAQCGGW